MKPERESGHEMSKDKTSLIYKRKCMKKERMGKRRLTKPSDFTYWNNWLIGKKNKDGTITGLLITGKFETIKEPDQKKHKERILEGDFDYICELIKESPYHLDDPILQRALLKLEQELSHKAPFNNESKEKLERLNQAKIPDLRGKKKYNDLKKKIKRDIAIFRSIVKEKERQDTHKKKDIIKRLPDLLKKLKKSGEGVEPIRTNRIEQIYKNYNKIANQCLDEPVFNNNWNIFFSFLEICRNAVDKPFYDELYQDFYFLKGDFVQQNNTLQIKANF